MRDSVPWNETVVLAFDALRANRLRALLTMLGVVIGSACIVLAVTISLAAEQYVVAEIEAVGSNLVQAEMINPGASEHLALADRITPADLEAVERSLPQVQEAAGTNDVQMTISVSGQARPIALVGVTEGFNEIRGLVVVEGRYLDQDELLSRSKVCLISEDLASSLFADHDGLGEDIEIGELYLTVVGVFRERVSTFGLTEIAPESVIVPFALVKDYTGTEYFKTFYAQADNAGDVAFVSDRVAQILAQRHRSEVKYRVWNLTGILGAARNISRALTVLLTLIALIALLVSGIGIMNIMLVTVTERTHEIGIRKAIGAPHSAVLWQFLAEAALISGTGALIGIAVGICIPVAANIFLHLPATRSLLHNVAGGSQEITLPISWVSVLLSFVTSCSTGLVFGYLPANRAAKLQPTDALRYE